MESKQGFQKSWSHPRQSILRFIIIAFLTGFDVRNARFFFVKLMWRNHMQLWIPGQSCVFCVSILVQKKNLLKELSSLPIKNIAFEMVSESAPSYNMNVNGYYQYDGNAFDPKAISRNYSIRPFRFVTAVIAYNFFHFDSRTRLCRCCNGFWKKEKLLCI